jgi:hypothetical protein
MWNREPSYHPTEKEFSQTNRGFGSSKSNGWTENSSKRTVTQSQRKKNTFFFRDRRGHFDWKTLAAIDVDFVTKDVKYFYCLSKGGLGHATGADRHNYFF